MDRHLRRAPPGHRPPRSDSRHPADAARVRRRGRGRPVARPAGRRRVAEPRGRPRLRGRRDRLAVVGRGPRRAGDVGHRRDRRRPRREPGGLGRGDRVHPRHPVRAAAARPAPDRHRARHRDARDRDRRAAGRDGRRPVAGGVPRQRHRRGRRVPPGRRRVAHAEPPQPRGLGGGWRRLAPQPGVGRLRDRAPRGHRGDGDRHVAGGGSRDRRGPRRRAPGRPGPGHVRQPQPAEPAADRDQPRRGADPRPGAAAAGRRLEASAAGAAGRHADRARGAGHHPAHRRRSSCSSWSPRSSRSSC